MTYTRQHAAEVIDALNSGDARAIYQASNHADNDQLSKNLYWLAVEVEAMEGSPELLRERKPAMLAKLRHYCKPEGIEAAT